MIPGSQGNHAEWNGSDGNFASNCREQPEPLSLHQRRIPNTITLLNYTLLYSYKNKTNTHLQFYFHSFWQYSFHCKQQRVTLYVCFYRHTFTLYTPLYSSVGSIITASPTLSSGMENLQQEARLVLAMVRLSFSTLVKLVLSSGTEINHKSVMTPSVSHRHLQSKSSPQEQFGTEKSAIQSKQTHTGRWAASWRAETGFQAIMTKILKFQYFTPVYII